MFTYGVIVPPIQPKSTGRRLSNEEVKSRLTNQGKKYFFFPHVEDKNCVHHHLRVTVAGQSYNNVEELDGNPKLQDAIIRLNNMIQLISHGTKAMTVIHSNGVPVQLDFGGIPINFYREVLESSTRCEDVLKEASDNICLTCCIMCGSYKGMMGDIAALAIQQKSLRAQPAEVVKWYKRAVRNSSKGQHDALLALAKKIEKESNSPSYDLEALNNFINLMGKKGAVEVISQLDDVCIAVLLNKYADYYTIIAESHFGRALCTRAVQAKMEQAGALQAAIDSVPALSSSESSSDESEKSKKPKDKNEKKLGGVRFAEGENLVKIKEFAKDSNALQDENIDQPGSSVPIDEQTGRHHSEEETVLSDNVSGVGDVARHESDEVKFAEGDNLVKSEGVKKDSQALQDENIDQPGSSVPIDEQTGQHHSEEETVLSDNVSGVGAVVYHKLMTISEQFNNQRLAESIKSCASATVQISEQYSRFLHEVVWDKSLNNEQKSAKCTELISSRHDEWERQLKIAAVAVLCPAVINPKRSGNVLVTLLEIIALSVLSVYNSLCASCTRSFDKNYQYNLAAEKDRLAARLLWGCLRGEVDEHSLRSDVGDKNQKCNADLEVLSDQLYCLRVKALQTYSFSEDSQNSLRLVELHNQVDEQDFIGQYSGEVGDNPNSSIDTTQAQSTVGSKANILPN